MNGIYFEPRTQDAKQVASDFAVVWLPKTSKAEVSRIRQTVAIPTSLVRMTDRFGLRCEADRAQELHAAVRPDSIFLSSGARQQYTAGPMPYGSDRASLSKAFRALGWEVKPLQPISSVAGRGSMWLVVAVTEPPQNLFRLAHGDVVVSKHKGQEKQDKQEHPRAVASAATLQLCGHAGKGGSSNDPWMNGADPWQQPHVKSVEPTAALQEFESKIEQAVLSKVPAQVAQAATGQEARIATLETQVQQLIEHHQHLEGQVKESDARQTSQLTAMQAQLNHNGQQFQQLQGAFHSQEQNIQAMLESQMSQIRGLLSKRPREADDTME